MSKKQYKTTLILAAFLLAVSALFAQQAYAGDGLFSGFKRFGKHTYAGPFDISKQSRKKAKEKLVQDFAVLGQQTDVKLIVQDQQVSVAGDVIRFDVDATLAQAVTGEDNPLIATVSREGLRTVLAQHFKKLSFTQQQIEILAGQMETQLVSGIMPQYISVTDIVPELYEQSAELATANIMEKSRIKAEKSNAIELINAANMYFIENPHHDIYINSVGVPTLVSTGYLDDFFLANDSFWMADAQPSWICGMAVTKKNRVEFRKATVKMILESGDSLQVGREQCGDMEALP